MGTWRSIPRHLLPDVLGGGAGAAGGARPHKYGASRAFAKDGTRFHSKAERDRYEQLLLLKAGGEIENLERQVIYHFEINGQRLEWGNRPIRYTADFRYLDVRARQTVVEDVKGFLTNDALIRLALMKAVHGIDVRLVSMKGKR